MCAKLFCFRISNREKNKEQERRRDRIKTDKNNHTRQARNITILKYFHHADKIFSLILSMRKKKTLKQ